MLWNNVIRGLEGIRTGVWAIKNTDLTKEKIIGFSFSYIVAIKNVLNIEVTISNTQAALKL